MLLIAAAGIGVWQWRAADNRSSSASSLAGTASSTDSVPAALGAVPSIAAAVPPKIRDSGRLIVGVNIPYAPNEFTDADGKIVASTSI